MRFQHSGMYRNCTYSILHFKFLFAFVLVIKRKYQCVWPPVFGKSECKHMFMLGACSIIEFFDLPRHTQLSSLKLFILFENRSSDVPEANSETILIMNRTVLLSVCTVCV